MLDLETANGVVAAVLAKNPIPTAGGVPVRNAASRVIGAVGVTGDSSKEDETCALAGIEHAGSAT